MSYFDQDARASIEQRKYRLKQIRAMSPTAQAVPFEKLDAQSFGVIEERALGEARQAARNSGRLFPSRERDDTGRVTTTFEGDSAACWAPFMSPGQTVKLNLQVGTHEETVRVRDGQRVTVA